MSGTLGMPAGAPPRLRRACRALTVIAAASWGMAAAGVRSPEAGAHRLVLAVALGATTVAAGCWVNGVRTAEERRAMAHLIAELGGPPEPSHDRLHAV